MADYSAFSLDPYGFPGGFRLRDFGRVDLLYLFGLPWDPPPPYVPPVDPPPPSPGVVDPLLGYGSLSTAVEMFLGYRPTGTELDGFAFDIYRFLIRSLRDRDGNEGAGGTFLLKRFLVGPQEVWFDLYRAGSELETLFDPETIKAAYLDALRRLVGFGTDLNDVVKYASEIELRRIIAGAIYFWQQRFQDQGPAAAVRLVTGNRFKVRDYFDFRVILDENNIMEDLENRDSSLLSVKTRNYFEQDSNGIVGYGPNWHWFLAPGHTPSPAHIGGFIVIINDTGSPSNNGIYKIIDVDVPSELWITEDPFKRIVQIDAEWFIGFYYDDFITEIRVVDEKTGQNELNRPLLEKLLALQRPSSERFNVVYVDFMDLFTTEADSGQWESIGLGADYSLVIAGGFATLTGGTTEGGITTNRVTAPDWENFQWKSKVAIQTNGDHCLSFFNDNYRVRIHYSGFGTGYLYQEAWNGAAWVVQDSAAFPDLNLGTYWTYTIEVYSLPLGDLRVIVYIDGNKVIDGTHTPTVLRQGNIGYVVQASEVMTISETELWIFPLDIVRIGPNP